jgi:hypothetical protein
LDCRTAWVKKDTKIDLTLAEIFQVATNMQSVVTALRASEGICNPSKAQDDESFEAEFDAGMYSEPETTKEEKSA